MSDVIDMTGKLFWKGEFHTLKDIISRVTPGEAPEVMALLQKSIFRIELLDMCVKRGYDPKEFLVMPEEIKAQDQQPVIKVGMGATMYIGSDAYAATVIHVSKSGLFAKIQRDRAHRIDLSGDDQQEYSYTPDLSGQIVSISYRANGHWRVTGRNGELVEIGHRRAFIDSSF